MNFSALSDKAPAGRALRAVLRLLPDDLTVPILQGRLRGKRWVVGSGVHGYWLGSFEWDKRRLFERTVSRGAVVFDIGANVGFYTLLAAELVGRSGKVFAFEPLPRNLDFLRKHLALNRVENACVKPWAVWDCSGTVHFSPGLNPSEGSVADTGEIQVPAVALDELVSDGMLPEPDVLKLDIEGGELRALLGARSLLARRRPIIFLATHGPVLHAQCCALLGELGYSLEPIGAAAAVAEADEILARRFQ